MAEIIDGLAGDHPLGFSQALVREVNEATARYMYLVRKLLHKLILPREESRQCNDSYIRWCGCPKGAHASELSRFITYSVIPSAPSVPEQTPDQIWGTGLCSTSAVGQGRSGRP